MWIFKEYTSKIFQGFSKDVDVLGNTFHESDFKKNILRKIFEGRGLLRKKIKKIAVFLPKYILKKISDSFSMRKQPVGLL